MPSLLGVRRERFTGDYTLAESETDVGAGRRRAVTPYVHSECKMIPVQRSRSKSAKNISSAERARAEKQHSTCRKMHMRAGSLLFVNSTVSWESFCAFKILFSRKNCSQ